VNGRRFLAANLIKRAALLSLMSATAIAAAFAADLPAPKSLSFISCPIYRDTNQGRKSGCWLADDRESGVRYDISGGRAKPQLGREVLVEGVVSNAPDACGGIVLTPLHTAVLETRCPSVMLPPENFPGRVFHVSPDSVLPPVDVERPQPQPPFASRQWLIEFNFQSDFLLYQYSEVILDAAARYIRASGSKRVLVSGFSATQALQVSGRVLAEAQGLAKTRAESVAEALRRLGVDPKIMRVSWHGNPDAVDVDDGLAEPSKRRVIIRAEL
jgi:outer membrane protein OmpA-like peptidoglycan-associated protein